MRFVIGIAGNFSAFPQFVTGKTGNDLNQGNLQEFWFTDKNLESEGV